MQLSLLSDIKTNDPRFKLFLLIYLIGKDMRNVPPLVT